MSDKQAIFSRLNVEDFYRRFLSTFKRNGKQAIGLCPWHDDHNPSLSVNLETGLYYCHACGAKGDLFKFYQDFNSVDFPTALRELEEMCGLANDIDLKQKVISVFRYRDQENKIVYVKKRLEPGRNGRSKEFCFRHLEGKTWVSGRGGDPIPYNLPELSKAKYAFITEGEAKADLLVKWGFVATCFDSGAKSPWRSEYLEPFRGKEKIVILPDNDEPGLAYGSMVANALHGNVREIKIVNLPGLQEKEDILDWARVPGNDRQKLLEIVKQAPKWEPEKKKLDFLVKGSDLGAMDVTVEWVIKGLLPRQSITLLHGKGGIGKTWLSLVLADAVNKGRSFMGLETSTMPVVYVDMENSLPVLIERIKKIGITNVLFWHAGSAEEKPPKLDTQGYVQYADLPAGALLIFDALRAAQGGDENNSQDMGRVMNNLKTLRDIGFTILLLHHTPKGNDRTYKGSTAIFDLADHVLGLHKVRKHSPDIEVGDDEETDCYYRFGTKEKTRYQPFHIFLAFEPEKGFVVAPDPDEEDMHALQELILELKRANGQLPNQKQIIQQAKEELDIAKGRVRLLLNKGMDSFWKTTKPLKGKNIKVYEPILKFQNSDTIYNRNFRILPEGSGKAVKQDSGTGCSHYRATGTCRAAYQVEQMADDELFEILEVTTNDLRSPDLFNR